MEDVMNNTLATLTAIIALFCLEVSTAYTQSTGDVMVTPDNLVWKEMPTLPKGALMAIIEGSPQTMFTEAVPFTIRLKLPANFEIPAHHHPWIEHATVISGSLNMGYGDKVDRSKTRRLPAGSVAVMQPGSQHFSWTEEETIVQIHGVGPLVIHYVDPAKDPRNH
jgi:hypothetical protein